MRLVGDTSGVTADRMPAASGPEPINAGRSGISPRALATRLFLVSLAILFGACLIGVLVVRVRATEWPPSGSPGLPTGLWVATAILVVVSAVFGLAVRAARAGDTARLRNALVAATALGIAFLSSQTANWSAMAAAGLVPRQSLFAFAFYVLTFLHAVHVLAGLVPLILITLRAGTGRYRTDPEPVQLVANYWHFLGVAWVAILIVLIV